jgi:hypothetical protein
MADVKLPRVNERETRGEKFIADCLEARGKAPKIEIYISVIIYRNEGWSVWLVAPSPPLTIEAWGEGLSDRKLKVCFQVWSADLAA